MTLICIDPGHAAESEGKKSPDGTLMEYEFTRAVAKRLAHHLQRHGLETMYSCDIDSQDDASLDSRCKAANDARADLFISIHANAYGDRWNNANGWKIYYNTGSIKGKALAEAIHIRSKPLGLTDRGAKEGDWYVIKHTAMPAVLVEHEFLTNMESAAKLKSAEWREKWAAADAAGILDYLGVLWEENPAEKELTAAEAAAIVKEKAGLNDRMIDYIANDYKYGEELIIKLAKAMS